MSTVALRSKSEVETQVQPEPRPAIERLTRKPPQPATLLERVYKKTIDRLLELRAQNRSTWVMAKDVGGTCRDPRCACNVSTDDE